ncbi:MAG: hypothetical protein RMY28_009285 [Nostoc sp. ChiSLP01]|nr:hypothetical protein [Nostoc sp. CmiSLP01]MDZ8285250.1 hypothetical protein [Nostoc sp. ChiSLP01]
MDFFVRLRWIALTILLIVVGCTPQLSAKEKLDECTKLASFGNSSIEPNIFGTDSKSFNKTADNFELNARYLREAKFRDAGIKNSAEQLALLNEKNADAARELGKTVDKLNQKVGDPELLDRLQKQGGELTKIGDEITALVNAQLDRCPNRKSI